MTTDSETPRSARSVRSRRLRMLVGLLAIVAVIGTSLLLWYIFFRPAGPPPIGPGAPVIPEGSLSGRALRDLVGHALA